MVSAKMTSFQRRGRLTVLLVFSIFVLTGSGCHESTPPVSPIPSVPQVNPQLKLALQLKPQQLRQMDPVNFTFRLSDAHGKPIDGATVTADLVMPTMDMGQNTVVAHSQEPGVYVGIGRFSMAGDWNVIVHAKKGAQTAVQTVPVRVL